MLIEVYHESCPMFPDDSANRPVAISVKPSSIALIACERFRVGKYLLLVSDQGLLASKYGLSTERPPHSAFQIGI